MNPWIALCAPFAVVGLMLLALKGCERYSKWRAERARRIRNAQMYRYGMHASRGTKDWWIS